MYRVFSLNNIPAPHLFQHLMMMSGGLGITEEITSPDTNDVKNKKNFLLF